MIEKYKYTIGAASPDVDQWPDLNLDMNKSSVPYAMMTLAGELEKIYDDVIRACIGAPDFEPNDAALRAEIDYLIKVRKNKKAESYEDSLGDPELRARALRAATQIIENTARNAIEAPESVLSNIRQLKDTADLAFIDGGGMMATRLWGEAQYAKIKEQCPCGDGDGCVHVRSLMIYPVPGFGVTMRQMEYLSNGQFNVCGPDMVTNGVKLTPEVMREAINAGIETVRRGIEEEFARKRISELGRDWMLHNLEKHPVAGFIFCNPNNPLGSIMEYDEWRVLREVFDEYEDASICMDEAHCGTVRDGKFVSGLAALPEKEHRITVSRSITKEQALTGHRIDVVFGGDKRTLAFIANTGAVLSYVCPNHGAQVAMTAGLEQIAREGTQLVAAHHARTVMKFHKACSEMGCQRPVPGEPEAAFYYTMNLQELFDLPVPKEYREKFPALFPTQTITTGFQAAMLVAIETHTIITPSEGLSPGVKSEWGLARVIVPGNEERADEVTARILGFVESAREYKTKNKISLKTADRILSGPEIAEIDAAQRALDEKYQTLMQGRRDSEQAVSPNLRQPHFRVSSKRRKLSPLAAKAIALKGHRRPSGILVRPADLKM